MLASYLYTRLAAASHPGITKKKSVWKEMIIINAPLDFKHGKMMFSIIYYTDQMASLL
jgi:hypothetical protein